MPMGFYQPAQIVIDAQKHGVEVRPVDVNYSYWDNILEEKKGKYWSIRLGFRQVKGLHEEEMLRLLSAREKHFRNIPSLRDAGVSQGALERLADADAFRSIGLDRRQALWEVSALSDRPTGMYEGQSAEKSIEQTVQLPQMTLSEHVVHDYGATALSLKAHPVSFVRRQLYERQILATKELDLWPDGTLVKVAGLVLVRQRPGTAGGVCFITIEDETGVANLVVFQSLFEKYRKEILHSRLLMVEGKLQKEGKVIHVIAKRCFDLSGLLYEMTSAENNSSLAVPLSRADEKDGGPYPAQNKKTQVRKVVQPEIFPSGRNFK
jgi:error-prone DNA polymerase